MRLRLLHPEKRRSFLALPARHAPHNTPKHTNVLFRKLRIPKILIASIRDANCENICIVLHGIQLGSVILSTVIQLSPRRCIIHNRVKTNGPILYAVSIELNTIFPKTNA